MQKSIDILDYIEESEEKWMEYCERMKIEIFKGLEELANYKLTHDSAIDIGSLLPSENPTTINSDWDLKPSKLHITNSYMAKARTSFLRALQTGIEISKFKLRLKEILTDESIS